LPGAPGQPPVRGLPLAPARVISLLDDIFTAFDSLAERHRFEKIKTIGDAYMVVGGLPEPRRDHATASAGWPWA
jgi:class 3 adenylate cyclase